MVEFLKMDEYASFIWLSYGITFVALIWLFFANWWRAKRATKKIQDIASNYSTVLVLLDSNHTHEHVLSELELYAPLTSIGSYCVVFDTLVEDMPHDMYPDRDWGPGDNPKTAARAYLKDHPEFQVDQNLENKLLISVSPEGYLKRVS